MHDINHNARFYKKYHATSLHVESEKAYTFILPEFSFFRKLRIGPMAFLWSPHGLLTYVRLSRIFGWDRTFEAKRPFAEQKAVNKGVTPCSRRITMSKGPNVTQKNTFHSQNWPFSHFLWDSTCGHCNVQTLKFCNCFPHENMKNAYQK